MNRFDGFKGIRPFLILWFGQVVSLVGSGLTRFALGVWVFEQTGSSTDFALIGLFAILPQVVLSPAAGVVVDRWNRRKLMILSDLGAGASTLVLAGLLFSDQLALWHIYVIVAVSSAFGSVQFPAYTAVTALLVPKEQLGRANGLVQLGQAATDILVPLSAGVLVLTIGLSGIILIDVVTFLFAVGTLMVIKVGKTAVSPTDKEATFWQSMRFGWSYINMRRGLLGLLLFLAAFNFLWGMVGALITPMILSFTTSDVLGAIISIAGGGMLVGSLIMSGWGGPKRRIFGVLGFELLSGFCFVLIGFRASFWTIAVGVFVAHLTIAIIYSSNQAIWQSKVPTNVQGRVFATQQMIGKAASPFAYLLAGPLADRIFEPMLVADGALSGNVGQVIGVGAGRGIGLIFVVMGIVKVVIAASSLLNPRVRLVEDELPDAVENESVSTEKALSH
ncbi:MAG: MFS transporter [Chloroflexi bacterium]|nr:MAG: MFS transporter [Chloroflexota bacterium]